MRCGMQLRCFFRMVGKTALEALLCTGMGKLLMRLERFIETVEIDRKIALGSKLLRKFDREAERII